MSSQDIEAATVVETCELVAKREIANVLFESGDAQREQKDEAEKNHRRTGASKSRGVLRLHEGVFDRKATKDRDQKRNGEGEGQCETSGLAGDAAADYDREEAGLNAVVEDNEGEKEETEQRLETDSVLHRRAEQMDGTEAVARDIHENQENETEG
jgi:hypothetical protein